VRERDRLIERAPSGAPRGDLPRVRPVLRQQEVRFERVFQIVDLAGFLREAGGPDHEQSCCERQKDQVAQMPSTTA
jgi:hypothetical protein